jgi:hypothetical protein
MAENKYKAKRIDTGGWVYGKACDSLYSSKNVNN